MQMEQTWFFIFWILINAQFQWKTGSGFSSFKTNGGNGEAPDSSSSIDKLKESAEEFAHKNASVMVSDDGEHLLVVTGEEEEQQLLKVLLGVLREDSF